MAVIHGFEVLEERDIKELNALARVLRHVKTGARLLSLSNNDENKVFAIGFVVIKCLMGEKN
jgi:Zn-dependent M16 (insulinase) family peptidase